MQSSALFAGLLLLLALALVAGHILGGPARENRRALAIMTMPRNSGIAMMLATQVFGNEPRVLAMVTTMTVMARVLMLLVVASLRRLPA